MSTCRNWGCELVKGKCRSKQEDLRRLVWFDTGMGNRFVEGLNSGQTVAYHGRKKGFRNK